MTVEAGYAALVILLALHFSALRLMYSYELEAASLASLVEGSATTPFQYRVLVPWLIGAVADAFGYARTGEQLAKLLVPVETGALVGLVYACRALLTTATGHAAISRYLPLTLFLTLPFSLVFPRYNNFQMPYDLPGILFFALGLLFLYRRKYVAYYLLFLVGLFNRETIGFLAIIFLLTHWDHMPSRTLAAHVAAQGAIWVAVKLGLYWLFAGSEGAGVLELSHTRQENEYLHVRDNLLALLVPIYWPHMASVFGYLWVPLLLFRRHITDPFVRRSLYVLIPFFGLAMVAANIFELRIFGDLYPVVLLALGNIAEELRKRSAATAGAFGGCAKG